ncbi:hypothetical protein NE237_023117 [Protea cynaroides]|uniref:Pentatricopeptide repeat-containing protein n=1 Tax=Protea cynaroides TaxID=273540 RepID=A0A9Q0HBM9_9MAGN|nr:hypothetical protein NE237_023117 [Protea cynaroides]
MNGLCKEGRIQEVTEVFDEMGSSGVEPDAVGYTTIINCFCRAGRVDETLKLLKEMEKECRTDIVTFNVILEVYLEKVGVLLPHSATSNELLISLCEAGKVADATEALNGGEMGFEPQPALWVHLIESISRERKLVRVFQLLDDLVIPEGSSTSLPMEMEKHD